MKCFEDGGSGCEPRNAGGLGKLEKAEKQILPSEPPEGTSLAHTLILAQ